MTILSKIDKIWDSFMRAIHRREPQEISTALETLLDTSSNAEIGRFFLGGYDPNDDPERDLKIILNDLSAATLANDRPRAGRAVRALVENRGSMDAGRILMISLLAGRQILDPLGSPAGASEQVN